ncbi:precorrin-3B synthase [Labrys miyagiensis]|uniref:Precorrin-3B synthase n=1 Tax=Labrys miyagiensis TaxID=346912 RepID=A0ABQ6CD93_9HYPH|nr:precorrin-3B synthase [Labrys miyagiensis]GLS18333.1 precorrin-3B synthase [Labrys miyagiensis]
MSGQRKGWCPGALKPMRTGDGLLVRVRLTGGRLSPALAAALAQAAREHGNGLFDLTARANLQLRGVRDETLQPLLDRLSELGVLDDSAAAEQVRNVLASPLAGLDETALIDVSPLVVELERRLTGDERFHALPPKFGFLVDGGGVLPLEGIEADIGLRAVSADAFRLTADVTEVGPVSKGEAVEAALEVAEQFLQTRQPEERRMRDVVRRLPAEARALPTKLGRGRGGVWSARETSTDRAQPSLAPPYPEVPSQADHPPSDLTPFGHLPQLRGGGESHLAGKYDTFFAAAAPFGRLDARQLEGFATLAQAHNLELRLTPWRAILLASNTTPPPELGDNIAALGLVSDPSDPRLAIAACPGSPSCLSGEAPAQVDAARLAPALAPFIQAGASVHVSGCAKGCARRAPASIVLVGEAGRYAVAFEADSKAASSWPAMEVDEIAAFLAKNPQLNSSKSKSHV